MDSDSSQDTDETPGSLRSANQAARRLAILDAAKAVFFDDGYQLASMDRIAERAGTTKRTVYGYFPSKEALFGAVVEKACASVVSQLPGVDRLPPDPEQGLHAFAQASAELMGSPNCIKLERLILAEAERHPHFAATLAQAFDAGEAKLAAYLDGCIRQGRLRPHDPALAARLLSNAIGWTTSLRNLLTTGSDAADPDKASQAIKAALALYLAAYRA
ncbi:MAG TPA: TetR/AcrR family transcriptional regulator [Caulobacteraceae bacterium]|jgi:TetR/AcrR family transcriptional regulator of autoinduction and epiphytic fitness|nr:TetR/AcrR family transcriptional regulator [Caulobacteraceae bacterium]